MAPTDTWYNRQIKGVTAGLGNIAGGMVNAVGSGISGAGRGVSSSISSQSRTWGNTLREYGNSLKDASGATGARSSTAANPLGLSTNKAAARAQLKHSTSSVKKGGSGRGSGSNPLGL